MKKFLLAGLLALLPLAAAAQGTTYSPSLGGGTAFTGGAITSALAAPAADNCAAVPYSFTSDTNTGLCTSAADTWNLYTAGASRLSGNSTAVTSTVPILLPAGTAAAPALGFVDDSDGSSPGWYRITANTWSISTGAGEFWRFSPLAGNVSTSGTISFGNSVASPHVTIQGEGAATMQLGADANGSAVAQTIKAHDGITGTDIAGANLTLAGGRGTGAGTPGNVVLATSTALGSGTTAQSLTDRVTVSPTAVTSTLPYTGTSTGNSITLCNTADCTTNYETGVLTWDTNNFDVKTAKGGSGTARTLRLYSANNAAISTSPISPLVNNAYALGTTALLWTGLYVNTSIQGSKSKTLVDNTATAFVRLTVADDDYEGCGFGWTAYAEDADTDARQVRKGRRNVAILNNSGTEACNFSASADDEAILVTAGTLTCTFDCTGGTNTVDLRATCDTSLDAAAETLTLEYRLDCESVITTVTPQ